MDVAALAGLLSQAMPALLGADEPSVNSPAKAVGTSGGIDARRIWECLGPRIAQCPAAEEATRKVAQVPSDARWRTALELQLEELFAREPQLAGEIDDLITHPPAARDGPDREADPADAPPVLSGDATVAAALRDAPAARAIRQTLHDVMARFCADGQPGDEPPGAIVFDRVDGRVCQLAREHSRAGRRRVVAVAAAPAVLESAAAWDLLDAGVADVVAWDGDDAAVAARIERWRAVDKLVASPLIAEHLVGTSPAWRAVLREVVEIARFSDVDVLMTGESGTGKELIAQLIHTLDARAAKGELIVVDCTTIVPSLSGSELFGHERGAFTGAVAARDGAFALADGGTLFLDEVGELPPTLQAELLRVVQEGTYKRVGSNRWEQARFRLVCATNRDLAGAVAGGRFRGDLYFRLAAATIQLPPLRERPEDVLQLARFFLGADDEEPPELSEPVRDLLQTRDYPGNVRDLKQLMSRIRLRHVGPGPVTAGDVPPSERPGRASRTDWRDDLARPVTTAVALGVPLRELLDAAREAAISAAVLHAEGSLRRAAGRLGVSDRTLQMHRARRRAGEPA
jgi:DNA-binding NtrC family response regulator